MVGLIFLKGKANQTENTEFSSWVLHTKSPLLIEIILILLKNHWTEGGDSGGGGGGGVQARIELGLSAADI